MFSDNIIVNIKACKHRSYASSKLQLGIFENFSQVADSPPPPPPLNSEIPKNYLFGFEGFPGWGLEALEELKSFVAIWPTSTTCTNIFQTCAEETKLSFLVKK